MKRTTISLTDELAVALEREARRRRTSVSEVVRRALGERFGLAGGEREIPFAAIGGSGQRHTARDLEEILASDWGHARDP